MNYSNPILRTLATFVCLMLAHTLVCSASLVFYVDDQGEPFGFGRTEATDEVSALQALAAVPTVSEVGKGFALSSGVLPGTRVLGLKTQGDTTTVTFSTDIIGGELDEARLTTILKQVRATLWQFGVNGSIRLETGEGRLLSSYLRPVEPVEPGPAPKVAVPIEKAGKSLGGRNICIGPSHGRFWNGSGWYWQRSDPCGFGEAVLEDSNSIRLAQFLYQYLAQDGATVHVPRELNESNCCNSYEGLAWWKMAAYSWLRANGLPCSVWANSSGNCGEENATGRSSDDIRARPLFADYRGSDVYIAMHSNAGGGGTANGTETFRDTEMEHPAHETASYNLALAVNNNVVTAIRETYPGEASWSNRGVKDSAGSFGEIRIPDRPACLIELAFHDNCTRDALYLTDNFFRSVAEWGLYKGVCEYFGTSPTWDKYSDEYVSDTIPTTMTVGQSYNVSVTFRNRGVVWSEGRAFRLGAVGESDPFTATTRHTISGEVRPGDTYSFNFTMTAPIIYGTYTTDWRMVRDGYAWFGATVSKQVTVNPLPGAPTITTQPVSQTVIVGDTVNLTVVATGDAPLSYQWRRNGADLSDGGNVSGATTTALTITDVQQGSAGTYSVLVTNASGGVLSADAVLTVNRPPGGPVITTQPVSRTGRPGDTFDFTVVATGDPPLSYQWRRNGADLSNGGNVWGVTTATLTITNAQQTNAGTYAVRVSNTEDAIVSADAVLTVVPETAHAATWGPYNVSANNGTGSGCQTIYYSASYNTGNLRTGWYTTTETPARCIFRAADAYMATLPASSVASSASFYIQYQTAGTYSSSATKHINVYKINTPWAYGSGTTWAAGSPWTAAGGDVTAVGTAQTVVYPDDGTGYTWTWSGSANCYLPNGVMLRGAEETAVTYRTAWKIASPTLSVTYTVPFGTANGNIRSWAFLGHYAQGATADHVTRINTDSVAGTYGGVPVDETQLAPGAADGAAGYAFGNSYGTAKWKATTSSNDVVNLLSAPFYNVMSKDNGTTYAAVYLYYSGATTSAAYLGAGSDDDCKVWINGTLRGSFLGTGRGAAADNDFYGPFTLTQNNWYRVVMKVENGGGGYGLHLRFANADRTPLSGCAFYTTDATAPNTPTSLAVSGVTSGVWQNTVAAPTFVWTAGADSQGSGEGVSGVRGHKYYFGGDSGGSPGVFQTAASFSPGAQVSGLYYFKVNTVDYALNESGAAGFTFLYDGTAPTDVSMGFGAITTDSIQVTGSGSDAHSGISVSAGYNYSRAGAGESGAKGTTHTWTGLVPNTEYTGLLVTVSDQTSPTPNTAASSPQSRWTLSVPPEGASITPDQAAPRVGSNVTWTAANGFGPGQVEYYRYAWDTSPAHVWTDTETQWSSGTLVTVPDSAGAWYLHIKGYNGAGTGNGAFDYAVTAVVPSASATTLVSSENPSKEGTNVTFTATVIAVPPATGTPSGDVVFLANSVPFSTNTLVSGIASASTASLPVGTNSVAAEYAGDLIFLSSSDSLEQEVQSLVVCSQTNAIVEIADNQDGTFTLTFVGTPQAQYYVVGSGNVVAPMSSWAVLPGSTNTVTDPSGLWQITVTNTAAQQFYRSTAVVPCP